MKRTNGNVLSRHTFFLWPYMVSCGALQWALNIRRSCIPMCYWLRDITLSSNVATKIILWDFCCQNLWSFLWDQSNLSLSFCWSNKETGKNGFHNHRCPICIININSQTKLLRGRYLVNWFVSSEWGRSVIILSCLKLQFQWKLFS